MYYLIFFEDADDKNVMVFKERKMEEKRRRWKNIISIVAGFAFVKIIDIATGNVITESIAYFFETLFS